MAGTASTNKHRHYGKNKIKLKVELKDIKLKASVARELR